MGYSTVSLPLSLQACVFKKHGPGQGLGRPGARETPSPIVSETRALGPSMHPRKTGAHHPAGLLASPLARQCPGLSSPQSFLLKGPKAAGHLPSWSSSRLGLRN